MESTSLARASPTSISCPGSILLLLLSCRLDPISGFCPSSRSHSNILPHPTHWRRFMLRRATSGLPQRGHGLPRGSSLFCPASAAGVVRSPVFRKEKWPRRSYILLELVGVAQSVQAGALRIAVCHLAQQVELAPAAICRSPLDHAPDAVGVIRNDVSCDHGRVIGGSEEG